MCIFEKSKGTSMTDKEAMKLALEALIAATPVKAKDPQMQADAIVALKEALAQPEQEPVATLEDLEQEIYQNTRNFVSRDVMEWMLKRYYTHPPQRTWVGLTDEDWDEIFGNSLTIGAAIKNTEAKLRSKNI